MKAQHNAVETGTREGERQIRRRGLLAAAVALGAGAVAKVVRPGWAEAANGDPLLVGMLTAATSQTTLDYDGVGIGLYVNGQTGPAVYAFYGAGLGSGKVGVAGVNGSAGGIGVQGISSSGIGLQGFTGATGLGIRGVNYVNGTGIKGLSNTNASVGADGDGSGTGVHGKSNSGNGVLGQSNFGWGVAGSSGNNVGVYGTVGTGTGVYGTSNTYVGVYGNSTGAATGVFGASTNGAGGYFQSANNIGLEGVSMTPNVPAIYGVNTTGGAGKRAAQFDGDVLINGSYTATGLKSAAVPHPDGSLRRLYSLESPGRTSKTSARPVWRRA